LNGLEITLLSIIVFFPIVDVINTKFKSDNKNIEYIKTALLLWLPTLLLVYLYQNDSLSVKSLGFTLIYDWRNFTVIGLLLIAIIYLTVLIRTIISNQSIRTEIIGKFESFKELMPESKTQVILFVGLLSVSAGICEELIFRAYLYPLLSEHVGMALAILISSLIFGLWHIYLGWIEVIRTSIMGAIFCGIYIFTDSILVAIAWHVFIDVYSGLMYYFANKATNESGGLASAESEST
jgi:membrane protease YdiL (CAAX protease family)